MRTGLVATIGILLVAVVLFFGACEGGRELPAPTITTTTTTTTKNEKRPKLRLSKQKYVQLLTETFFYVFFTIKIANKTTPIIIM